MPQIQQGKLAHQQRQGQENQNRDDPGQQRDAEILHGHRGQIGDHHGQHQLTGLQFADLPLSHQPQADHNEKIENDRAAQCGDHVRRPLFVPVWTTDGILYGQLGTDGLKIYILPLVSTVKNEYDRNDFKLKDKGAYCSDG